jgi:hypothetical protein
MFFTFSAAAHPYDAPLTFRKHLTDDGRVIWSNIPKACFSKGLLTCENLHPIYGMPVSMKRAEKTKSKAKTKAKTKNTKSDSAIETFTPSDDLATFESGSAWKRSISGNKCHKKGTHNYEETLDFDSFSSKRECDAVVAAHRPPTTKRSYRIY